MEFAGICLATKDVRKLSAFYQAVLQTVFDCDGEIHQEIRTQGAALAILRDENAGICGNPKLRMAFTVDDVDAEFARLQSLGVSVDEPPETQPWGARNLSFLDPGGNRLTFRSFQKK
ncbi:MAG: glyoxalase [Clostridiales bacterium]|nr:MAG: glyoxalase [Clostridiales bacterium]